MYYIRCKQSDQHGAPATPRQHISAVLIGLVFFAAAATLMFSGPTGDDSSARLNVLMAVTEQQLEMAAELEADDAMLQDACAVIKRTPALSGEVVHESLKRLGETVVRGGFRSVLVADAVGNLVYASPNLDPGGSNVASKAYFADWKRSGGEGLFIGPSDPASLLDGGASIVMSRVLRNGLGDFVGIVAAIVPLRLMTAHIAAGDLATLLASGGAVISRFPLTGRDLTREDQLVAEAARAESCSSFTARDPATDAERIHGFCVVGGFPLVLDVAAPPPQGLGSAITAVTKQPLTYLVAWIASAFGAP